MPRGHRHFHVEEFGAIVRVSVGMILWVSGIQWWVSMMDLCGSRGWEVWIPATIVSWEVSKATDDELMTM
jgi:hypothetical protein